MSVNTLNFEQVSTVLTALVKQATGQTVETPTNTGSFASVAQIALRADHDSVMNAISNYISRTLFSIRSYASSMNGLMMEADRWGAMMRKLSICDDDWQDDPAYKYPVFYDAGQNPPDGTGGSVDPWKIKKPNILQTNFYGQSVYFDEMTITEEQLKTAFSGPEQLGSFLSLCMTNLSNRLEQSNETLKHGLVCNMIGALYAENDPLRVVKLLTMYNAETGNSFTNITIKDPANFPAFVKWAYAKIEDYSDMFKVRGEQFQTVISGKHVLRHSPKEAQRVYLYSPFMRETTARVIADTFHDTFLRLSDVEAVPYWQSQSNRDKVNVFPSYTDTSGAVVHATGSGDNVEVENVLGVMFDRDMMGMGILDRDVLSTPLNTRGRYRNIHVHCKQRIFFDNTEKGVIFLLA